MSLSGTSLRLSTGNYLLLHNDISGKKIESPLNTPLKNRLFHDKIPSGLAQIPRQTGRLWEDRFTLHQQATSEKRRPEEDISQPLLVDGRPSISTDKNIRNKERLEDEKGLIVKCCPGLLHLCAGSQKKPPIIGKGSVSTVYDTMDGYVVKRYTGKLNQEYKSRLQYANNNAKGFNRLYGQSSGFVSIQQHKDGSASVAVRLLKINGNALNTISHINDESILKQMQMALNNTRLAENLANVLMNKGIAHYDINKGNIIYSLQNGFSFIDFDSAVFSTENEKINPSITHWMTSKLDYILNETKSDIAIRLHQLTP